MLPHGAKPIWDARMAGKKPAVPVFVSLLEDYPVQNPVVRPDPRHDPEHWEWKWVRGLEIVIVGTGDTLIRYSRHVIAFAPRVFWAPLWWGLTVCDVPEQKAYDLVFDPSDKWVGVNPISEYEAKELWTI